jgi:predicted nucleic-acid-binding Zn-ribbon protein
MTGEKMMKCVKCDSEMIQAELTGNNMYPLILKNKKKGIFDSEMRMDVLCYVCPECGYIELYAKDPKKLKG